MVTRYVVLVASVCAALLACIGTVGLDADATQAAEGRYVAKCGGGRIFLNSDEARIFYLQNRERRERDRKTLCLHPALKRAARGHARDMMERDYTPTTPRAAAPLPGIASAGKATTTITWGRTSASDGALSGRRTR